MSQTTPEKGNHPDKPPLCAKPDDLYSDEARHTLSRLASEWLARQRLTATELLHNAHALEKFEATGAAYQHVIQKVAIPRATELGVPVAETFKPLDDLCTVAIHRVYKDDRSGLFPLIKAEEFGAFSDTVSGKPDDRYILNGVLSKYLASAKDWNDKLQRLLKLMSKPPANSAARALLVSLIDSLLTEILNVPAALAGMLGHHVDLGRALLALTDLFLGIEAPLADGACEDVNTLARHFAKNELALSRASIADRILSELNSLKRLCPNSPEDELKITRKLANQLVHAKGRYFSREDLIGAFTERSKRLVTQEALLQFMQTAKTSDEKVDRLLHVEETIIGADNKRMLSEFILPIVTLNSFEDHLCAGAQVQVRLRRVAELQMRVLRAGFPEVQRGQIAVALDAVAQHIEERAKFLASIETRFSNPVERAQALLKLFTANVFTQGNLSMKARRAIVAALAKPGFRASYLAHVQAEKNAPPDANATLANLTGQLQAAGISREEALRMLAA